MSIITNFFEWIKSKTLGGKSVTVSSDQISEFMNGQTAKELGTYEFAIHVGINLIANALSKCEVRTFRNGKEIKGAEYYMWNYQPNINMNASQFWQKVVWSLIYKNECLVVQNASGDLLIADFYVRKQYANYPDTFEQVTIYPDDNAVGSPFTFQKTFSRNDVFYFRLSNRNIADLLSQICTGYDALLKSAIQKFYKSGGERGTLTIDTNAVSKQYGMNEDGTPRTFTQVYNEMMNKEFKSYFDNPNGVITMWAGFDYQTKGNEASKKSTSEIKDVTDIEDRAFKRVGNALQIPPVLLSGDVADVKSATNNFITFCIDPFATMLQREITRQEWSKATVSGNKLSNYYMIDTSNIYHTDIFDAAVAADKLIADSIYNVDEIRIKLGDAPLNTPESQKYSRTKNLEDSAQGGNGNADTGE